MNIKISQEILDQASRPQVALESSVITNGLPYPHNLEIALELEAILREQEVIPVTMAIIDGEAKAGVTQSELERLSEGQTKLGARDLGTACAKGLTGGTTVSATMAMASHIGISVFATGGIGGVHRSSNWDISQDLEALSRFPVAVVCAGAKSILDLEATLEVLETKLVPVIGYKTDRFPAFLSNDSGLSLASRVDSPEEVSQLLDTHWQWMDTGLLICQAVDKSISIDARQLESWTEQAEKAASLAQVKGKELTPFLLSKLAQISEGKTLDVNLELLRNNVRLAGQIANGANGEN